MKIPTKILIIIIGSLMILASLIANIYFIGWKQVEAKLMQKGVDLAVSQIMQTVNATGQIQLDKDFILIKK